MEAREREEHRNKLKIKFRNLIDRLIRIIKGQEFDEQFYSLVRYYSAQEISYGEIRSYLQNAWWIEEEDVRQHLLMTIWRVKLTSHSNPPFYLLLHLRDYLKTQRVFMRQIDWEENYRIYEMERFENNNNIDLSVLFNVSMLSPEWVHILGPFNRYLLYLLYILEVSQRQATKILGYERRQICRIEKVLNEKIEEYYGKTKISGRYRKRLSAKRRSR